MTLTVTLAWVEGRNLLHLVDEFASLLDAPRPGADPALRRLTPPAYPGDPEATAEFRRSTSGELLDRRRKDAARVRTDLVDFDGDEAPRDTLTPVELSLAEIDPWLRTLAAIRLVVAERLGIAETDHPHDPDDSRFAVYDWLGYRLEDLIQRADEEDDASAPDAVTG